jgi:hypothetical protein
MTIFPQCQSLCNTVHDRVTATIVLRNAGLPMDGQFFSSGSGISFSTLRSSSEQPGFPCAGGISGDTATQMGHLQVSGAEGSALWLSKLSAHTKLYEGSFPPVTRHIIRASSHHGLTSRC